MSRVPHLLVPTPWNDGALVIDDGQVHHLRSVLRLSDGADLTYTDGAGTIGRGRLVGGRVERGAEELTPRPSTATIAVAPPSSRARARFVVEKLAEIGVAELMWIETARSEGRPPPAAKSAAWVAAAVQQSLGAWSMTISEGSIDDVPEPAVVAHPDGSDAWPQGDLVVVIGPEGGLTPTEMDGRARVSLGPTVLRVETAAVVAAAAAREAARRETAN